MPSTKAIPRSQALVQSDVEGRRAKGFSTFLVLSLFAAAFILSGCNTVSGIGEDISAAGRGIDQSSEWTQDKMSGKDAPPPEDKPYTQKDKNL